MRNVIFMFFQLDLRIGLSETTGPVVHFTVDFIWIAFIGNLIKHLETSLASEYRPVDER